MTSTFDADTRPGLLYQLKGHRDVAPLLKSAEGYASCHRAN